MDEWYTNSADHSVDVWVKEGQRSIRIRQREYDLYFEGREDVNTVESSIHKEWVVINGMSIKRAKEIHTSCYNVEEWYECPELLNQFMRIDINEDDLLATREKSRDTNMYRSLLRVAEVIPFPWFVRTSSVSPKDVVNIDRSAGEMMCSFSDAFSALYAIATSKRCNVGISSGYSNYMWISKYKDISEMIHYRVFIRESKVRAISQYDDEEPPLDPKCVRNDIISLWNRVENDIWYEDCVMDILHREDTREIYIIEFNEFGASSRAGSALYHWIQDIHTLYLGDADIRVNQKIL